MVSVKWVLDRHGRKVEAIVPYEFFEELIVLKRSMEIYSDRKTQQSIKAANGDLKSGRYKGFSSAKEAIKWLKKE